MYNVNTNIDSEARATNFLDPGIHDDVYLMSVEYKTSPKGNDFMVFNFEKDGKSASLTEWAPSDEDPEKLQNKTLNQIKRVKHIVTKFIDDEKFVFDVKDFKEFCAKTIEVLGNAYENKSVRIKVVYGNNNFTSLPRYIPFIEKTEVPKDKSRLEIISIDKMVKDRPDTEQLQTNPFETKTEITEGMVIESADPAQPVAGKTDDLPF